MKNKWQIPIMTTLVSVSFLTGCNDNSKNNNINEKIDVDNKPIRYERNPNPDNLHEDPNRGNKPFPHDEPPSQTNQRLEKGENLEFNKSRGAE
ncbi:hypothetical protein [Neobacillus cucumis]|uniref:hypothetical protein n=1 Tax=Neobacillus cucumis TaxID=1740721 RepID=UPI002853299F|nr:hypothetical protein [Neobacillus cucumis]MDR4947699.1 hypothetical protein [Neobacillus cucumis]